MSYLFKYTKIIICIICLCLFSIESSFAEKKSSLSNSNSDRNSSNNSDYKEKLPSASGVLNNKTLSSLLTEIKQEEADKLKKQKESLNALPHETQSTNKDTQKIENKSAIKPAPTIEPKPKVKPKPTIEPKPTVEPKPTPTVKPKPTPTIEPKPEIKTKTNVETQTESTITTEAEAKKKDVIHPEKIIGQDIAKIKNTLEFIAKRMSESPVFTRTHATPNLLMDEIINQTHDENLNTKDLDQVLQDYIFNNTSLKMLPPLQYNYHLIAKTTIKTVSENKDKKNKAQRYFINIELYDKSDKLKGYWSATTP